MGTYNNTQTYTNRFTTTFIKNYFGTDVTNRDAGDFVGFFDDKFAIDFNACNTTVKVGSFGFKNRDSETGVTATLDGSNTLPDFGDTSVTNNSFWTSLGSVTNFVGGWNFINCTNVNYWRYFRVKASGGVSRLALQEIEFYNSSALSSTINFT